MTPNQSGEQSEQIPEELLAHYWGDGYEVVGYPSMEYLKVAQPDDYAELMALNGIIRRREQIAVKEALEVIWRKSVAVYPPDPQAQYEQLTGINKYVAEQLHALTQAESGGAK